MGFNIAFDYRFDSTGFFDDPEARTALEAAGQVWEDLIQDEFNDVPAGIRFTVTDPSNRAVDQQVVLGAPIDDLLVFVGADTLSGDGSYEIAGSGGPTGTDARGTVFDVRIEDDFRGTGPITDFEPWAGSITFSETADWNFALDGPVAGQSDFISTATHELGHVLGFGTTPLFNSFADANGDFAGPNALTANGGSPVPMETDFAHVEDGFMNGQVLMDPTGTIGERKTPTGIDLALMADIGYEIEGFQAQGTTPPIATDQSDGIIFGTVVDDTLDGLGGDDQLQGDEGDDTLRGGDGNDNVFGQDGDDILDGGAGKDFVDGGFGADVFRLGDGDTLERSDRGEGADRFVAAPGSGTARIQSFTPGTDRILIDPEFGFVSGTEVLDTLSKPSTNVSSFQLSADTVVEVLHTQQSGTPLSSEDFEIAAFDFDAGGVVENAAPVAGADSLTLVEGDDAAIDVLANDSDPDGDMLSVSAVSDPANGSAAIATDGRVTYMPNAGFSGSDSFTYTVVDGNGGTATGTVDVTVEPAGPVLVKSQARVFLRADGDLTVYEPADLFGRGGESNSALIAQGARNIALDGNVDRIDLPVGQAETTFQVVDGQLEIRTGGDVLVRVTGGLNQEVDLRFADGDATLAQTGAASFDLTGGAGSTLTVDSTAKTPSLTLGSNVSATAGGSAPQSPNGSVANVFLEGDVSFTIADPAEVFGRGGGQETVELTQAAQNVSLDGNIERVELPQDLSATTFEVVEGQLQISFRGTPLLTFTGGLNQDVVLQFGNGEGTLSQTGAASFTLSGAGGQAQIGTSPVTPDIGLGGNNTSAIGASDDGQTFDSSGGDETFDFADGTYGVMVHNFSAGDVVDFADVGGSTDASFNVLSDSDQADGEQVIEAVDPNDGSTVTVTLVGLSSAQDSNIFNQSNFESEFGSGSIVL
jgi:hypothetical protein